MSIRFKFRSSVNFDAVQIDGRDSISILDLRSKILEQKKLKVCNDFDLIISDSVTGEEYDDDNFLVPSGSSVIIKRVPAGRTAPPVLPRADAVENLGTKRIDPIHTSASSPFANVENFDDFGIDLYPALGTSLLDLDVDDDKINGIGRRMVDGAVPRCSEPSIVRHQNLESSDLSDVIERGVVPCSNKGDTSETKLEQKVEEHKKLDELVDASSPALAKYDLPSELRCSLCNAIFKEAVMIPCCQHSFCEKCIRLVLVEKARCPKCSSTKCKVIDLLPNVSLRQAIEHFLESQMISGSENALPKYAPDGESGIQAKEVSCAVSIRQREPLFPHSPSETGKGSNQVMTESAYDSVMRNSRVAGTIHLSTAGKSLKSASSSQKMKQMRNVEQDGVACPANYRGVSEGLDLVGEFQGENQPSTLPQTHVQKEEANSVLKKKGLWVDPADGVGSFAATAKYRRGDRTCYKCGSPDHLIRDCPAASGQFPPMLQTAYGPSYWHGASYPQIRPYGNMYATPGVMPFTPTMIPVAPLGVPSYVSPMYGGMSVPWMGGFTPSMVTGADHPVSQAELIELQDSEQRHKHLYEHPKREQRYNDLDEGGYYYDSRLSHDCKPRLDEVNSESYSGYSDTKRSLRKRQHYTQPDEDLHPVHRRNEKVSFSSAGRDPKAYHPDASSSEMQSMSDTSDRHSKERHKHHQRTSTRRREKREHCGSDSSRRSHPKRQKEVTKDKKRVETEYRRHSRRHEKHSEFGLEPSSSGDRKRQSKDKESSHGSRHSRHTAKSADDQLTHERWEMVDGLDEDLREEYCYHHKCKRIQ